MGMTIIPIIIVIIVFVLLEKRSINKHKKNIQYTPKHKKNRNNKNEV